VTRDVQDPVKRKSVYDQWQERTRELQTEEERHTSGEARITPLGSGSDYTPFLQHLGIASTDMSFGGDYGVYHSAYDSFYWMDHFGDPGFFYHVAAAQIWGLLALRLADADGLSFDYTDYANEIRAFFREGMKLAGWRSLGDGLDDKSMNGALDDFAKEAERIEKARQDAIKSGDRAKLAKINDALMNAERGFIDERGLRGRTWYKHQIYAPGIYTGYAAQPLTDFRQALDDRNATNAKEGLARIVEAMKRATATLKQGRD
jgi:N-acetylated-alpha-linked acidic dipeptidase